MKKLVVYVHGKGGNSKESEHYKALFCDYEVVGLDYKTFSPWETGPEIHNALLSLKKHYDEIVLIANSIGAFFCMNAELNGIVDKAFFISPLVDMEKMISQMMLWANVTEKDLKEEKNIHTAFGEDLSWHYLCYVRNHRPEWSIPTHILHGKQDNLISKETIELFKESHNATLTEMENGEHWFHTEEQMRFLDNWIKSYLK